MRLIMLEGCQVSGTNITCPFLHASYGACRHPDLPSEFGGRQSIRLYDDRSPEWCPMRKQSLLVCHSGAPSKAPAQDPSHEG